MARRNAELPDVFPVEASYVVEGRNDKAGRLVVSARYVVFPDGRRIDLPLKALAAPSLAPDGCEAAPRRSRRTQKARQAA